MRFDGHKFFVKVGVEFTDVGFAEDATHGDHRRKNRIGGGGMYAQNRVSDGVTIDGANGLQSKVTE
jgi:hypothetical protein